MDVKYPAAMCRAVWVMIVAPSTDVAKTLRRAAGPEAQVVAMPTSSEEAIETLGSSRADVVIISSELAEATDVVSRVRDAAPQAALVWVGPNPPEGAHASIDEVSDALEGAITRGLLAARAAK
jgi:methylmalonyl-CoA mutase cobalamin-binding subunit